MHIYHSLINIIGRAPSGARGLKPIWYNIGSILTGGRAPSGARGLKQVNINKAGVKNDVAPLRGRVD